MAQLFSLSGQTLVDGNGTPYAAAKAAFYLTGTTTPQNTYSDAGLSSANTNPVVADANGRFPDIYLSAARYKVVLTTSADVAIDTLDPVDATSQLIAQTSAPGTTYPFLRYHNTTDGNVYRRNAANSAWINEGPVDSLISGATVSEVLTGTATDKAVTPDAVAGLWQRGTDLASASTLSLPAGGGGVFNVTGTTGITGISSAQGGRSIKLRFASACVLTHNGSSFILPGAANITTVAGDCLEFINDAAQDASSSNWRCFKYQTGDNRILLGATQAQQETGTSTTIPVTPGVQHYHLSACKAWCYVTVSGGVPTLTSPSYNVSSITDTGVGLLTVNLTTSFSSVNYSTVATPEGTGATGFHATCSAKATGSVVVRSYGEGAPGGLSDPTAYSLACFGDL